MFAITVCMEQQIQDTKPLSLQDLRQAAFLTAALPLTFLAATPLLPYTNICVTSTLFSTKPAATHYTALFVDRMPNMQCHVGLGSVAMTAAITCAC
jgi:hypothetical protein